MEVLIFFARGSLCWAFQYRAGSRPSLTEARAAALHLVEIKRRLHVARKDQHLQRSHVCAGGDHVDGDGNARVVVGAELPNQLLGVGDLLREIVAAAEDVSDDADGLFGVMVVLAEDEGLRPSVRPGNGSVKRLSR
jgi:hypothetical protein